MFLVFICISILCKIRNLCAHAEISYSEALTRLENLHAWKGLRTFFRKPKFKVNNAIFSSGNISVNFMEWISSKIRFLDIMEYIICSETSIGFVDHRRGIKTTLCLNHLDLLRWASNWWYWSYPSKPSLACKIFFGGSWSFILHTGFSQRTCGLWILWRCKVVSSVDNNFFANFGDS